MSIATVVDVSTTNLNQLLAQVKKLDEIILVRNGLPLARVLPYQQADTFPHDDPTVSTQPYEGDAMSQEIAAFTSQHAVLIQHYLHQHVAIFHGQVVDHDTDSSALLQRINANFPEEIVLIRQVRQQLPLPLHIRSPRLIKLP